MLNLILSATNVKRVFMDCFYTEEELSHLDEGCQPADAVVVEGITGKYGFKPERVEKNMDEIILMLNELPESFKKNIGGGASFLSACEDRNGVQWTGEHRTMEQLFALGIAIGKVEYCMPREFWQAFPGGMPYLVIN